MKVRITADRDYRIGEVSPRLFGSFIEHLGRAVYGGIYEPEHPEADDQGFRKDVLRLVRELDVPIVRYPGGNFVSGYRWQDGTGPRELRPRRQELAWNSIEPNLVGIDEFQEWAKRAGSEVMMAVNLGTGTVEDARDLVEYCNFPGGTALSDRRRANGFEKPFGIRTWCLGNEMDGPWQIGHRTAEEYGRIACEAAKAMKMTDPAIELIACGSSSSSMPTFGEWETTVLKHCYEEVDYLSLHSYYGNRSGNSAEFLACSRDMDRFITDVAAICDAVKAIRHSQKTMYLSFDEWNVWFHSNEQDKQVEKWTVAPPLLEDVYTFEDALVAGCLLITLLRHCDRVKIACLAQLVNVIAPIMTETGGRSWAQTIFYPFRDASRFGRGTVLDCRVDCPSYDGGVYGETPTVEAVSLINGDELTLLAVNRSLTEEAEPELKLRGLGEAALLEHRQLWHDNLMAVNTADAPETVLPSQGDGKHLLPHSWNVLRYRLEGED